MIISTIMMRVYIRKTMGSNQEKHPAIAVYRRCGFVEARRRGTLDRADTIVMERTIDDEGALP
jgi:hypothetical protein